MQGVTRGWVAAVVAVASWAGFAGAQEGRLPIGVGRRQHGDAVQTALARLDLTPEQQAKAKAIADEETAKIAALRSLLRPAHDALDAAAHAANPDPAAVGTAYLKALAAENAVKQESAKYHDAIAGVLTPEQRTRFEAFLGAGREARGRWEGWRGGANRVE